MVAAFDGRANPQIKHKQCVKLGSIMCVFFATLKNISSKLTSLFNLLHRDIVTTKAQGFLSSNSMRKVTVLERYLIFHAKVVDRYKGKAQRDFSHFLYFLLHKQMMVQALVFFV